MIVQSDIIYNDFVIIGMFERYTAIVVISDVVFYDVVTNGMAETYTNMVICNCI